MAIWPTLFGRSRHYWFIAIFSHECQKPANDASTVSTRAFFLTFNCILSSSRGCVHIMWRHYLCCVLKSGWTSSQLEYFLTTISQKSFGTRRLHRRTVGQGFQKNPLRPLGSNFERCVLLTLKGSDGIGPFDGAKSFHLFVAQVNAVCNPWRKGASLSHDRLNCSKVSIEGSDASSNPDLYDMIWCCIYIYTYT